MFLACRFDQGLDFLDLKDPEKQGDELGFLQGHGRAYVTI
jgi:hypothetical protein